MSWGIMRWGVNKIFEVASSKVSCQACGHHAQVSIPIPIPTPTSLPCNRFPLIPPSPSCLSSEYPALGVEKCRPATSPEDTMSLLLFSSHGTRDSLCAQWPGWGGEACVQPGKTGQCSWKATHRGTGGSGSGLRRFAGQWADVAISPHPCSRR